jgi:hypothetical protein
MGSFLHRSGAFNLDNGWVDGGPADQAALRLPMDLAIHSCGDVLVSDLGNDRVVWMT